MIEVKHLKKNYNDFEALKGISYEVEEGEVFGILGPNGAGKSTMIKILTCFHKPTSGSVTINKIPIKKGSKIKKIIGWVSQEETFYEKLTIEENLEYFASLYNVSKTDYIERSNDLLKMLEIDHKRNAIASSLSGGMKRRLSIAIALIHKPKVLYLDEPTAGVDPVSRRALWEVIKKIKKMSVTTIFCTHYIDEAELLCDRVAVLAYGKVIALGTPKSIKKNHKSLEDAFIKLIKINKP